MDPRILPIRAYCGCTFRPCSLGVIREWNVSETAEHSPSSLDSIEAQHGSPSRRPRRSGSREHKRRGEGSAQVASVVLPHGILYTDLSHMPNYIVRPVRSRPVSPAIHAPVRDRVKRKRSLNSCSPGHGSHRAGKRRAVPAQKVHVVFDEEEHLQESDDCSDGYSQDCSEDCFEESSDDSHDGHSPKMGEPGPSTCKRGRPNGRHDSD